MDAKQKSELGQQLVYTAQRGDLSEVESLIAQGADVNHTDTRKGVSVALMVWLLSVYYYVLCSCDVELQVDGLVVCQPLR
jgi:hypothetical protein